jgi:hypothetical protein
MADPEAAKGDDCEEIELSEGHGDSEDLTKEIMKNPEVLAAVQDQLMMKSPAEYVKSLPKVVKRRLKALKRLQADVNKVESKFYEEVHELEQKYAAQYEPFFQRRREIVTAQIEPTDAECDWPSDDEELADELNEKAKIEEIDEKKETEEALNRENTQGVPDFWLTIFKNVDMLAEMVQPHDEPILKHLQDVQLKLKAGSGFVLEFVFEPNDYFTNPILTKEYFIRFSVDSENPLGYEGPDIVKCNGCTIDWKKGKNVTVRLVKKVQKHKNRGTKRTVTQTVKTDSFFNFFDPPKVEEDEEPDEDTETLLTADFEIGHFLRENIIPRAILYFTGEALDEDDDYDPEEGEDENEDDDDDDDDSDGAGHPALPAPKAKGKKQNPEDCKQQ